jgi:hypothetical protein
VIRRYIILVPANFVWDYFFVFSFKASNVGKKRFFLGCGCQLSKNMGPYSKFSPNPAMNVVRPGIKAIHLMCD